MTPKQEAEAIEGFRQDDVESEIGKNTSRDVDDALRFTLESNQVTWTEEQERKVVRKIDAVVLSMLFLVAVMSYADNQAYGFAALFGLVQDLKLYTLKVVAGNVVLDTSKYSFSAAIATLGAVAGQYPLLLIAQRLPAGKVVGSVMLYTGMIALLTITCSDYGQIMALRFFSGFAVVLQPLSVIITAMWWKTDEQPLRAGIFISGSAIGNLIGQGVDFGAIKVQGAYAASPWKWIYVILGTMGMGLGLLTIVLFPANPMKAWFLSKEERGIAVRRLVRNNTGIQTRKFKWKQVREAYRDPQLYALSVYAFSFAFVNNAIGSFGGFLVSSFGYSASRSLVLSMPASAVSIVCMVSSGILGSLFPRKRILISMFYIIPSIIGNALLWKGDRNDKAVLLAGLYVSTMFYGALVQLFSLLSSNIAGHTKKTVINATIFMFANLGGFCGPWAYKGDEKAKGYPTGQISALSLLCGSEAAFLFLWFYYLRCNKKKAVLRQQSPELVDDPNVAFMDLTDQENPVFQYVC